MPKSNLSSVAIIVVMNAVLVGCLQSPTSSPVIQITLQDLPTLIPATSQTSTTTDLILLSMEENGYYHLFSYSPGPLSATRLTYGDWNDIDPAPSPDRSQIAFASNRNGFWDLYTMDLSTGVINQVTSTPEYDAAPSWSPDGQWLVYETYLEDNLEIAIVSLSDSTREDIRLTAQRASDHSPVWSPDGRRIAFVSTRTGDSDIWMADLDLTDAGRFSNLSNTPTAAEYYPAWDGTGSKLIWASTALTDGYSGIYLWENGAADQSAQSGIDNALPVRRIGDGSRASWSTGDQAVVALFETPHAAYLTEFDVNGSLRIAPTLLSGNVRGLAAGQMNLPSELPELLAQAASRTPTADWALAVSASAELPPGRWSLVPLPGVQAPFPKLHDLVDDSFLALRQRVLKECGWDALASLENAFVPLSITLDPGFSQDWLYTGRAFAINSLMANVGWMAAVREDYAGQTYWRIFLRCLAQDGTQGEPLHTSPWDLNARYDLDPLTYEQGGRVAPVPSGYWLDVTSLAAGYGWERLAALPNWRSYYAGARFTEFALTGGLDWYAAMRELYPAAALVTPTRVLPPTLTPTRTPRPTSTLGPTRTPRPTLTPSPTRSASPTSPPSNTPPPSPTPPTIIP